MSEWKLNPCPNCGKQGVHPMSEVGERLHYRCPQCLWSWHRPLPADRPTCHGELGPGAMCSECGAYNPNVR